MINTYILYYWNLLALIYLDDNYIIEYLWNLVMTCVKGTDNNLQKLHRKQKIEQHEPHYNRGWTQVSRMVSSSCGTIDTRYITLVTKSVISHEWGNGREVLATRRTYPCSWRSWNNRSEDFNLANRFYVISAS